MSASIPCAMCGGPQQFKTLKSGTLMWACPHCDTTTCRRIDPDPEYVDDSYLKDAMCDVCRSRVVLIYQGTGPGSSHPPSKPWWKP